MFFINHFAKFSGILIQRRSVCIYIIIGVFFQALKALILERMGKAEEALSVCLNAKELLYNNDSVLMDDLTLSTLQIVFQRLDHCQFDCCCLE